jgi:hypothetical protein
MDLLEQNAIDEWADDLVESPEVEADDGAGDDHDDDTLERLATTRPVDLPELGIGLAHELAARLRLSSSSLLLDRLLRGANLSLATPPTRRPFPRCGSGGATLLSRFARHYLVSRCAVCRPHQRQYLLSSTRSGEFRFDFWVW